MAFTAKLELRQSHSLVMTPQLQQAIKLLQLSNVELTAFVEAELERNPLLEREDNDDASGALAGDAEAAARPFAGIDPKAVDDIQSVILYLRGRGIGILITDHNVRETLDLVTRAYIIHDGMVLTHGTAHEIINNEDVRRVYLGDQFKI